MSDNQAFEAATYIVTRHGVALAVAPLSDVDRPALEAFFAGLSAATLFRRYFTPLPVMTPARTNAEIARLHDPRHQRQTFVGRPLGHAAIAVLVEMAIVPDDPATVEVALVVADSWQGQGIGAALAAALPRVFPQRGIAAVRATGLTENRAIGRMFAAVGPHQARRQGDLIEYWAPLR